MNVTPSPVNLEQALVTDFEEIPFLSTHSHPLRTTPYRDVGEYWDINISPLLHMSNQWHPVSQADDAPVCFTQRPESVTHQHLFRTQTFLQTLRDHFGYSGAELTRDGIAQVVPRINACLADDPITNAHRALDMAKIAIQIVNALAPEQCSPRLRTAPWVQTFLYDDTAAPPEESFHDFLAARIALLRQWRTAGAVALKLAIAYSHSLALPDPSETTARAIYDNRSHTLDAEKLHTLNVYLLRQLLRVCNELAMPVQIHTGFGWASGRPLQLRNASVQHLIPLFEDPDFRRVRFMIFHGSWPETAEVAYLANVYQHVYLDFNCLALISRNLLTRALDEWLDLVPLHKLMTGTDAPTMEFWITAARENRRALARVLSGKISDGLFTEAMARDAAHAILHANAEEAYNLCVSP